MPRLSIYYWGFQVIVGGLPNLLLLEYILDDLVAYTATIFTPARRHLAKKSYTVTVQVLSPESSCAGHVGRETPATQEAESRFCLFENYGCAHRG